MTKNLFIGGLSRGATDIQLKNHFTGVGKVIFAKVIIDRQTGLGKGFGFVEMDTEEQAKRAIRELNHTEIDGKSIEVKEARSRE